MHLSFLTASFRTFYCISVPLWAHSLFAAAPAWLSVVQQCCHHTHQWLLLQMLSLASVTLRLLFSPWDELKQDTFEVQGKELEEDKSGRKQASDLHGNIFQMAPFLSFKVQRLMHNRKCLYSSNISWPPTVRTLQCVMSFHVCACFTWNGNVLLLSFPMINHILGVKHLASPPFKSQEHNADLSKSLCWLQLEFACVNLHLKVRQTTGGGWGHLIKLPCFVFLCIFLLQILWRVMKLLHNTRMTVKTLVCSLCCCLQRARSDEIDLKITNPEIICNFSHVFLLYLEPRTTASATYSIFFSSKKSVIKKEKEKREIG